MYRRYTVHRDGDLLVEDLDAAGKPLESDPVPAEDRLPIEVVLLSPDTEEARAAVIDLLELALEMETTPEADKPRTETRPQPGPWRGSKPT